MTLGALMYVLALQENLEMEAYKNDCHDCEDQDSSSLFRRFFSLHARLESFINIGILLL